MNLETIVISISIGPLVTTSPCEQPLYPDFQAYLNDAQAGLNRLS
jgi:hypothetical protein